MNNPEHLSFLREGDVLTAKATHATLTITLEADDVAACALDFNERETLHVAVQGLYGHGLVEEAAHVTFAVYSHFTSTFQSACVVIAQLTEESTE